MERLEFDSGLFGIRVCRADEMPGLSEIGECDLVYVATREVIPDETLRRLNGCLADRRRTYCLDMGEKGRDTPAKGKEIGFEVVDGSALTGDDRSVLRDLAIQSGHRCRFRNDPLMPTRWFHRMYRLWMDNSIKGEAADLVLATRKRGRYVAMATLRKEGADSASIGLVSVDREQRGTGLGRALMHEALYRCVHDLGRLVCEADTHADDQGACAFYEIMGFEQVDQTNVYHLWPNGPQQEHHE